MPVGYLVTTIVVAWCTLLAVAPIRRPRSLGRLSWASAFIVDQAPALAMVWLLAASALALAEGDVASVGGKLVLALAGVTTVGLAVLVRRSMPSRATIEGALDQGLGPGWRHHLGPEATARSGRRPSLARTLLAPFAVRRRDVERVKDIAYGDAGRANRLDLYRHRAHPTGGPVLVHLHGGGFGRGRKDREARPLLYRLASQGWVCISANYRLKPAARFPDQLVDAKRVVAWARAHAADYGADADGLFVAGSSAGAHLAAMVALTPDGPAFPAASPPGSEPVDPSVRGAICLYGYYGPVDADGGPSSSPMAWTGSDAPPFFVAHGDHDTYVPVEMARAFVAHLRARSPSAVVYAELPGAQHTFDVFHSIRFEEVVDGIDLFTRWVGARAEPARQAPEDERAD